MWNSYIGLTSVKMLFGVGFLASLSGVAARRRALSALRA